MYKRCLLSSLSLSLVSAYVHRCRSSDWNSWLLTTTVSMPAMSQLTEAQFIGVHRFLAVDVIWDVLHYKITWRRKNSGRLFDYLL